MKEWKKVKLKDITISITDGKHGDCKGQDNSGYYFISCKDVSNGTIHYENARQITKEDFIETDKRTNLATNDILITNSGTIGRMAFVKDIPETRKTTFQKSVAIVKPNTDKVLPIYLYYLLQSKVSEFVNSSNGAAQKNLLLSTMREFELSIEESFSIQQRIATILSRYDSLIENYQKQIKLLEESAQRLYKEWFIDLRFPGHEYTKIVDGVPDGWEKKTLDSFCNVFTGKKNANQGVSNGKYKFFTCGDTPLLINSYIYDGPAIIISGNGSYTGRTTFYEGRFDLYQRTYACTMKDMLDENLIYGLFEIVKYELTNKISGGTHGAAIPYIVMSDVTKFDFLYEENIMQRFSSIMHNILSESLSLLNQIRHLTEARDRLLPKLMSGEVIVNH